MGSVCIGKPRFDKITSDPVEQLFIEAVRALQTSN